MVLKVCLQCGEEFEAKRSTAKFCGVSCRKKYNYRQKNQLEEKTCLCGKHFIPKNGNQEYCSDDCSAWAQRLDRDHNNACKSKWSEHEDFDDDFLDYIDYK